MPSLSNASALQKSISDQFYTLFLLWCRIGHLPSPETYRHSHHLPNDFCLLGMLKGANRDVRQWVRLEDDLIPTELAPAADITIPGLDEVDRTLELRPPGTFDDTILGFIYLHKTTWRKKRVHREVFSSDVPVGVPVSG
jgi:hypothetical protein